jgi:hypothetical protein
LASVGDIAIDAGADLSTADALRCFHSLGETCEFGFAQRAVGIEPLYLFRFIGLHDPVETRLERMIAGLAAGFVGLGDIEAIRLIPLTEWNEYCFWEARYGLFGHTGVPLDREQAEKTLADLAVKLTFLRRKFLDNLAGGEKILIWKSETWRAESQILSLLDALRQFGPNQIVWIPPVDDRGTAGVAEIINDNLVRATMTRTPVLGDLDPNTTAEWDLVCRQSLRLLRPLG